MFKYLIYKFGQFCVNHLSLKTSYCWAGFVSDLHYYFSFRDRKAVRDNLRVIYRSEERLAERTKEVFRNFGKYLVEFFLMKKMVDENFVKKRIKMKNIERLHQVVAREKGAIILTAHIGNWELGGVLLSRLGYPIVAIALPHKERPVNDLFNHQREVHGVTVVPTHLAIRKCMEALKKNQFVALVADRDFNSHGEILEFLGRKACIPRGAAIFSQRSGAPILPTFLLREGDGSFTLSFGEPIFPPENREDHDPREIMLSIMRRYTTVIEKEIRKNPTQWLMFRRFWVNQSKETPLMGLEPAETFNTDNITGPQSEGSIL